MSERHLQWLTITTGLRTATLRGFPKTCEGEWEKPHGANSERCSWPPPNALAPNTGVIGGDQIAVCWN